MVTGEGNHDDAIFGKGNLLPSLDGTTDRKPIVYSNTGSLCGPLVSMRGTKYC